MQLKQELTERTESAGEEAVQLQAPAKWLTDGEEGPRAGYLPLLSKAFGRGNSADLDSSDNCWAAKSLLPVNLRGNGCHGNEVPSPYIFQDLWHDKAAEKAQDR